MALITLEKASASYFLTKSAAGARLQKTILQTTDVQPGEYIEFNLILPKSPDDAAVLASNNKARNHQTPKTGAIRISFKSSTPISFRVAESNKYIGLSSSSLKNFALYLLDIVVDHAELDESADIAYLLKTAKDQGVEAVIQDFYRFVSLNLSGNSPLQKQAQSNDIDIGTLSTQEYMAYNGNLLAQINSVLSGRSAAQREINSVIDREYRDILSPNTTDVAPTAPQSVPSASSPASSPDAKEDNTTRNILIATGVAAIIGIGVFMYRKRNA